MKKSRILLRILKMTHTDAIVESFVVYFLLTALGIMIWEPSIHTYGNALWYCFTSVTTIGYGDLVAVTLVGRILIILLTLYGIFVIALIPGVLVSYYTEMLKARSDESLMVFLDKLEHLPELSKEELTTISNRAKEIRKHQASLYKIKKDKE